MKLKPLRDRVVVKPLRESETTKFGIVIPETAKERPEKGEVLAVGPGRMLDNGILAPMNVKVGDQVIFKSYSPNEFKIDGQEYFVLDESDILAVIA